MEHNFAVGDKVKARGIHYWLTITNVSASGWFDTRFGSIGGRCGKFKAHDLKLYDGEV